MVPTCSIEDDQIDDTLANLDSVDYAMVNTVLDAQRQVMSNGEQVHAIVGPPCMTGMCPAANPALLMSQPGMLLFGGLAAASNMPIVSYYAVAFQMQSSRSSTFKTLSTVSMSCTQQGGVDAMEYANSNSYFQPLHSAVVLGRDPVSYPVSRDLGSFCFSFPVSISVIWRRDTRNSTETKSFKK